MRNTNTDIQSLWVNVCGIMEEVNINSISAEHLIQYLDNLGDWDYDETLPVMESLCERLGLDLADYEYCDDCFDAICETYHKWELDTDVDSLKLHLRGKNAPGPIVKFHVVRTKPADAEPVEIDGENYNEYTDIMSYFNYYYSHDDGRYYAVRNEI